MKTYNVTLTAGNKQYTIQGYSGVTCPLDLDDSAATFFGEGVAYTAKADDVGLFHVGVSKDAV